MAARWHHPVFSLQLHEPTEKGEVPSLPLTQTNNDHFEATYDTLTPHTRQRQ